MLSPQDIDMLMRGGVLMSILPSCWIFWREQRHTYAGRLAVALSVAGGAYEIASMPQLAGAQGFAMDLVRLLADMASPLLLQFARVWFGDKTRLGGHTWALVLAPTVIEVALMATGLDLEPMVMRIWQPAQQAFWLTLGLAAMWIAWRRREDDLVELRRRVRMAWVVAAGCLGTLINVTEIAITRYGAPADLRVLVLIVNFVTAATMVATMIGMRQPDIFGPVPPPKSGNGSNGANDPLVERLRAHMETERPWRDEGLTIAMLAAQLGEQEYKLRRAINGALGFRNFAQFLNGYRLAEVKHALADPAQREVPIVTIALDAGFGSLASFNRVFREAEGVTPSDYRRLACSIPELR